jgi:hypothetical protein
MSLIGRSLAAAVPCLLLTVAPAAAENLNELSDAEDAAVSQCQDAGGDDCEVVGTFKNGGCGYISVGHDDDGSNTASAPRPMMP